MSWVETIAIGVPLIMLVILLYKLVEWIVNKVNKVGFKNTLFLSLIILSFIAIMFFGMSVYPYSSNQQGIFGFVMLLIYYNVWKKFYMIKNEHGVGDVYNTYDFGISDSLEDAIQKFYGKKYLNSVINKMKKLEEDDRDTLIESIERRLYALALKDLFYNLVLIGIILIPSLLFNNSWISILIFLVGYSFWDIQNDKDNKIEKDREIKKLLDENYTLKASNEKLVNDYNELLKKSRKNEPQHNTTKEFELDSTLFFGED